MKLKQGFKTCFSCTVYEYIVEKRMEMAYRLLQKEKYKVKDVVWMVGYSNTSHFIEAFRKRYGITPPPEKYSYKSIEIIAATFNNVFSLHDVSKTMFLTT